MHITFVEEVGKWGKLEIQVDKKKSELVVMVSIEHNVGSCGHINY